MSTGYRSRLSIEISQEQDFRKRRLLPHGVQKIIFNILLDEILDLIEEKGLGVLGPVMNKGMKLTEVLPSTKEFYDETR